MPRLKTADEVTYVKKTPKKPKTVLQKCVVHTRDLLPSLLSTYRAILQRVNILSDVTLTWEKFTEVWNELKCFTIYYDVNLVLRRYAVKEFTEEALTMAKDLWFEQSELKKQTAAFFLLSAMFLQQPFQGQEYFVNITLNVAEGEKFCKFCEELECANCDDALQVVVHMWDLNAFSFRATRYVHGLEPMYQLSLRRDLEKSRTPAAVEYSSGHIEMLKEFGNLVSEYLQLKRVITPAGTSRRELGYIDESTFQLLQSYIVPEEPGMPSEESGVPTEEPESIETRRKRIKKEAFQRGCVPSKSTQVEPKKSLKSEEVSTHKYVAYPTNKPQINHNKPISVLERMCPIKSTQVEPKKSLKSGEVSTHKYVAYPTNKPRTILHEDKRQQKK